MAATNSKTTTKKPSTKKTKAEVVENEKPVVKEEPVVEVQETVKNPSREYAKDDLIPCRSVTAGYLGIVGPRTKQHYPFENMGDVGYIEYQDLNSWLSAQHPILFRPYIIVDDNNLLDNFRWAEIRKLYESMSALEDIDDILGLSVREFEKKFPILPIGLKDAVKSEVVKRINDGTFDSIGKIKVIDNVCGTSIGSMIAIQ